MTADHTSHIFDAMHVEACLDQVLQVFWDQTQVSDQFDHILLSGPHFAGDCANLNGGNWDPFDPEVNGLLIETNNFASGVGFVIGQLTMHGWTPVMFSFAIQNPSDFDLVAPRDYLVEISLGYFSLLY